jgi:predicted RNA-binding Zn ribbon-like protein
MLYDRSRAESLHVRGVTGQVKFDSHVVRVLTAAVELANGWAAGCASGLALALGSDLAGRLGVCAAPACDRVYVEVSRNAQRRFCSPQCQSRVKAAAHRARRAAS